MCGLVCVGGGGGSCVCRVGVGGLVCVRGGASCVCKGGGVLCVRVWDWGGRMVIERFTNLMFDNRSIILHGGGGGGGESSLSTYCIFPRQTLGKPYLVQFQIIISIKYDTFFVLTLKKCIMSPFLT